LPVLRLSVLPFPTRRSSDLDNHLTAGPYRRVTDAAGRGHGRRRPRIRVGTIPTTGVLAALGLPLDIGRSGPDDHFGLGPNCRVSRAADRDVICGSWRPFVRHRIVTTACVGWTAAGQTTPYNHFSAR